MAGFHVEHFGCRAARADGEALSGRLRAAGLNRSEPAEAELIVVNTCSVTAEADRAARAFIRRTHRFNPDARIVVTGCYAQRAPEELAGLAGVVAVVGNSHKALAPEILIQLAAGPEGDPPWHAGFVPTHTLLAGSAPVWVDDRFAHSFIEEAPIAGDRLTRASILRYVEEFVCADGNELVLSGINLGRWGRDLPAEALAPRWHRSCRKF